MVLTVENTRPGQDNTPFPVTEDLHVLAAGRWDDGALRLTLQLDPKPDDGGDMNLRTWPADIAQKLSAGVYVSFIPLSGADAAHALRPQSAAAKAAVQTIQADVLGLSTQDTATWRNAVDLWNRSLQPQGTIRNAKAEADATAVKKAELRAAGRDAADVMVAPQEAANGRWADLAQSLNTSQANAGIKAGRQMAAGSGNVAPLDRADFGVDGQIKGKAFEDEATIGGVLPVPHADLALALDQQRAHELRLSLAEACGEVGLREAAEAARCDALDRDAIYEELRPLLDTFPLGDTDRKALQDLLGDDLDLSTIDTVRDDPETQSEKTMAAVRRALKLKSYYCANENLNGIRERAASAYKAEADRLRNGGCGAAPASHDHLCATRAHVTETREDAMAAAQGVHDYASWPQYKQPTEVEDPSKTIPKSSRANETLIVQRFAAIKSDPVLARIFGLSADLRLPADTLAPGFYLVAATTNSGGVPPGAGYTWTLCEVAALDKGRAFWPATEFAAARALACANSTPEPTQSLGFLALSSGACGEDAPQPRFDLSSIDLRSATEGEMQRRMARQVNVDTADPQSPETPRPPADALSLGPRILTGGLTFLMRSASNDAALQLARRDNRISAPGDGDLDLVLDADDLMTGTRALVGLPDRFDPASTRWFPLEGRCITYGTSGEATARQLASDLVDAVLPNKWERSVLEHSYQSGASRLLPAGEELSEAVIEEAVTTWDGSPMGVDFTTGKGASRDIHVFGRTYSLHDDARPAALRFGVPYRVALSVVYSGGVSPGAETFGDAIDASSTAAYPPRNTAGASTHPAFRFLRHEKIAAPGFAIPVGHALRGANIKKDGDKSPISADCGPMGFDTGPRMVVRSVAAGAGDDDARMKARGTPSITHRVILAPSVPFDLAEWHGAFDTTDGASALPASAYPDVLGARALSGAITDREALVVTSTTHSTGLNNRASIESRTYTDTPQAALPDADVLGDAVFKMIGSGSKGASPVNRYYADPLATRLAFAIRLKGETQYLSGGPLVYDLGRAVNPSDPIPVVVTVQTGPATVRKAPVSAVSDIVTVGPDQDAQPFYPDAAGDGFADKTGKKIDARELRLVLRPGEDVEIDVWVLPTGTALARDHALVQALGVNLSNCGRDTGCDARAALLAGARAQMPGKFADCLAKHLASASEDPRSYTAPGGLSTPDAASLKALGATIVDMLHKAPLPEVVGLTTLTALHASNRAPARPAVPEAALPLDPQEALLPALAGPQARPMRAARPADLSGALDAPMAVSAPAAATLVLDGAVAFDAVANDSVEIVADVTLPGTTTFDDRNRGRSLQQRRKGEWPPLRSLDGTPLVRSLPGQGDVTLYRDAEDLFGFEVSADGGVRLRAAQVNLLRVEGLPRALPGGLLDLRALFLGQLPGSARIAHRHIFPDGKARRMQVRLNALSRTMEDMRTAARVASAGDPWTATQGEGRVYNTGDHVPAEPVPAQFQAHLSEAVEIVLPATIRPAKPDAKAPIPLLDVSTDPPRGAEDTPKQLWHQRASSLRIPLGREWYSSGEDEQVGIVLWPPQLGGQSGTRVKVPGRYNGDDDRVIDLADMGTDGLRFSDDDLGPGGAFVSRRGSDPVRGGRETEPVLRPSAIADLFRVEDDIRCAEFVPDVLMPLDAEGDANRQDDEAAQPPMRVGLALYRPRFDPEREEWFIDITLDPAEAPDGFVRLGIVRYQPHAIPALRCSRPVVQWAQPLGARTARVSANEDGVFAVQIDGPAACERAPFEAATADATDKQGVDLRRLTSAPAMRLTLFRESTGPNGATIRRLIKQPTDAIAKAETPSEDDDDRRRAFELPAADCVLVSPQPAQGTHLTWRHGLDLSLYEDGAQGDGRLKLLIEEIEHFRPASYAEEPVADALEADWRTRFQETGPRFSALFDLEELI
ncbi:MAG: hypothetical protein AAFO93_14670 [Pseudomonadota bacterium]